MPRRRRPAPAPAPAGADATTPAKPAPRRPRRPGDRSRSAPIDGGWPRIYDLPSGGTILVYQPQVASWDKQKQLVAFSAVSHRAKAGDKPAIGTIKLEARHPGRR